MKAIQPVLEGNRKPYQINDLLARILGVPLVAVIMHFTFGSTKGVHENHFHGLTMAFLYTLGYWEGLRNIWMALVHRYPHYSQTRTRLLALTFWVIGYGAVLSVIVPVVGWFLFGETCTWEIMIIGYLIGFIPTGIVLTVYEAVFFFELWKNKVQEQEAISRTQLANQLDALKAQLDPHFLFNSLNTLSSLIDENEPAQEYLSRLADVYRYVLLSRDRNTVSLAEEMEFVNAYLYLAKVRFGESLKIEIELPPTSLGLSVAPLSIQLLVENALKHNAVTRENPLLISIRETDGYIQVSNAIQPKVVLQETTTKVGLRNILERYRLLSNQPVRILDDAHRFEVSLPLLPA